MYFEKYVKSSNKNISQVRDALNNGVTLSRAERFDFLFKKELCTLLGIRKGQGFIKKKLMNMVDLDYRLASFYANGLLETLETLNKGYTVKGIKSQLKSYIRKAEKSYICTTKVSVNISDCNGEVLVQVSAGNEVENFTVKNKKDYIQTSLTLISLLGSIDEKNMGYRNWFSRYLFLEFNKIETGKVASIYIETKQVNKSLGDFVKVDNSDKKQSKVIRIAK